VEAMGDTGVLSARVKRMPRDAAQEHLSMNRNGVSGGSALETESACLALLEIEDSGSGMPPDVREMIFEPFYTTKRDGTGLGLATVQRLVEQHGGSIQVSSRPGEGTCFRIFLECVEPAQ